MDFNETKGHLFYTTPRFVINLKAIGKVKPELQLGQSWVKIGDFLSRATLKFDGWPWQQ